MPSLFRSLPLLALAAAAAAQTPLEQIVPGRFIVTYAAGMPMTAPQGTRLLTGHPRLGIAILQAKSAAAIAGPGVQMVVADRVVAAQQLVVHPDFDPVYHSEQGWAVR